MTVIITLAYNGKEFSFASENYNDMNHADFMWTDGNFGCDCNKSLFIQQQCDKEFPVFDCGDRIELINIKEGDIP